VGRTFRFLLGKLKVRYTFESTSKATLVVTAGAGLVDDGHTETVAIELREIRPNVYVNSWREASGATVSHVEDFENGVLVSNVTLPDGRLVRMTGAISEDGSEKTPISNK
jgi:hypothetical protein